MTMAADEQAVERWGVFELALNGPSGGNPFVEVELVVRFQHRNRVVEVDGFYDGDGVYRVRLMPDTVGEWCYETSSSAAELEGAAGTFTCKEPGVGNYGPVRVSDTYHFSYANGVRYYQIGTTCYAWAHQGDELEEQTLASLAEAPFNKMRMCVFPKDYVFNRNEPVYYPFQRAGDDWDFTRFNPEFFRHFEERVLDLMRLGIEADVILFHPYDRWGFSDMGAETDDRYLRYIVARLAAYRNVWWSLANEFDILLPRKPMADWDRFFRIIQECDHAQHLRSIHNCRGFYDHGKPWVTHCSVQHGETGRIREWRRQYGKPVIDDECCYEGNIENGWGNITAQELVRRFWVGALAGGYVGHGETYLDPDDVLWWSKGGVLHGESPARITFLKGLLEDGPQVGLEPVDDRWDAFAARKGEDYYLYYFDQRQPGEFTFHLPEQARYRAEVIDTWGMTVTPVDGEVSGKFTLPLPSKAYTAVRLRKV
jgi:hypothetical protein